MNLVTRNISQAMAAYQSELSLVLLVLGGLIITKSYFSWSRKQEAQQQLRSLPYFEANPHDSWQETLRKASAKAHNQYPHTPFVLRVHGSPRIIIPNRLLEEIRTLPEDQVSLKKDLYEKMHGRWTEFMGDEIPLAREVAKKELTNNVNLLLCDMQEEVNYALNRELPRCQNWTRIVIFPHLMNVSALFNGRFFVGAMGRDKTWNELALGFAPEVFKAAQAINQVKKWLRPVVAPYLVMKLTDYKVKAGEMLRPHIEAALETRKHGAVLDGGGSVIKSDERGAWNAIPWMLNHIDTSRTKIDQMVRDITREQLFLASGSIRQVAMNVFDILFDLASRPEYIPELRAEIDEVMAKEPGRTIRKNSLPRMRKLDSLLRESQRMNPVNLTSVNRRVTAPNGVRLSTGHILPYDTALSFMHPHAPYSTPPPDLPLVDPELASKQPPLTEFYPFRYSEAREMDGEDNEHQFTHTGRTNLAFGFGKTACPGRWFAAAEIKIFLIEILSRYDVALGSNGEGKGGGLNRPKQRILPSLQAMVDDTAALYLKDRS